MCWFGVSSKFEEFRFASHESRNRVVATHKVRHASIDRDQKKATHAERETEVCAQAERT